MSGNLEEKLHRLCRGSGSGDGGLSDLSSYLSHGVTGGINHGDADAGDAPMHHAARSKNNSCEMAK